MERRELLYGVVRNAMIRAGILSASYKFKVLSLDPRGREFVVMMDLASECVAHPGRLSGIEALISEAAKTTTRLLSKPFIGASRISPPPALPHRIWPILLWCPTRSPPSICPLKAPRRHALTTPSPKTR